MNTAQALYNQASDQVQAGTSPAIDGLRAQVELKTRQQQLIQAKNDLAIQKLALARVIGLAPGQQFELTDKSPYAAVRRNEASKKRCNWPTIRDRISKPPARRCIPHEYSAQSRKSGLSADDFIQRQTMGSPASTTPSVPTASSTCAERLSIPIFQGGKVHGDVIEANAQLEQSRQRLENLQAQIDADVRTAF